MDTLKKYDTGFTQVSNKILTEPTLSIKAKGIYAYLFSKPDGWQFYTNIIKKELNVGYKAFHSGIKELIDAGYITKTQKNENGKFGGNVYDFATPDKINRLAKMANRQNGKTNNTYIKNNTKEKIKNKKEKSLRDSKSNPYGVPSEQEKNGGNMNLIANMEKARAKYKEALQRKKDKQEAKDKSPFQKKTTDIAGGLNLYFLSLLSDKQRELTKRCLDTHKDNTAVYRFVNCCKNMGFDVYTQKKILAYCVTNWETIVKIMKCFVSLKAIPNISQIADFFYMMGFLCDAYGLGINPDLFRSKSKGEFNASILDFC